MHKIFLSVMILLISSSHTWAQNHTQVKKQEIMELARANTTNVDGFEEVRVQLDLLIADLTKELQPVDEQTWATYSPGAWHQIWSDEADNSPAGAPARDLDKIFQYVTANGRAVNFGQRLLPNDQAITFALEAVGEVQGEVQTTKILAAFSRGSGLEKGEDIATLAADILEGKLDMFQSLPAGEFPNGPINAQSDLKILFLDEDLKIGTAPNVFSGESELFILQRVQTVH
jgi:hypothetical protein